MPRTPKSDAQIAIGGRLKLLREIKHLTQSALGDIMGVGTTTVAAWEAGRNQIDAVALGWAAETLGFSTDFIILGDVGSLRVDLAVQVQMKQRAMQGVAPTKRGPKPGPPRVRDLPDGAPSTRTRRLHELPEEFIPKPKNT